MPTLKNNANNLQKLITLELLISRKVTLTPKGLITSYYGQIFFLTNMSEFIYYDQKNYFEMYLEALRLVTRYGQKARLIFNYQKLFVSNKVQ